MVHECSCWIMSSGNWALWGMFQVALGVRNNVLVVLTIGGDAVFADPCIYIVVGIIV
jgi:hypothetical protein